MTSKIENNYTGIAKARKDKDGKFILVACRYQDVGIYSTCVKMKDGKVTAIGLGGFREETAFSETDGGKAHPVVIESFETQS